MAKWNDIRLGNFLELKRGYDLPSSQRSPGPYPLVSSSGVSDFHSKAMVKGPGVITGRYGTIGEVFFVNENFWPLNTTLYVRDFKGNDPRFCYYFLKTLDWQKFNDKSGVPGVNRNDAHLEPVKVPLLAEQKVVSAVLGAIDDKIDLNRCMNKTLEAMSKAIFKDWLVDFGPVRTKLNNMDPYLPEHIWRLFPDKFNEEGKPEGWMASPVKTACYRIFNGGTPKRDNSEYWIGGTVPWLTSGEVRNPYILETKNFITDIGFANSSAKWVDPGSTVVALYGATAGQVSYVANKLTTNQAVCALMPKPTFRYFLYLSLSWSTQTLSGMARGSAQQNLSKGLVEDFPIIFPSDALMEVLDATLDPIFKRIIENENEIKTLSSLRDFLLPRIMSGEVRVCEAEKLIESTL